MKIHNMKHTIYLVGQISPLNIESYKWRINFINHLKRSSGGDRFNVINPCDNNFNSDVYKTKTKIESEKHHYISDDANILVPKDLTYVLNSDIIIANLNHYDKKKPLIGSFFELAWCYLNKRITVIGIHDGAEDNKIYKIHPFIDQSITTWVKDYFDAVELINKYFCND